MRLWIRSDLHGRLPTPGYYSKRGLGLDYDVAVLAGDIASPPADVVDQLVLEYAKPVVYVAGNHEFYRFDMSVEIGSALAASRPLTRIHYLENSEVTIDGVRFLGTTLWTDYDLHGTDARGVAMANAQAGLNDHEFIRFGGPRFTPSHARALHLDAMTWLENRFAEPFDGPTVVVTHHAPSRGSLAPRWREDPISPSFVSDLSAQIFRWQPDLWIHGHVHDSFDYRVGRTRIVCNPKGYGGENAGAYDPHLVVEVG